MTVALNTRSLSTMVTEIQRIFQDTSSATLRSAAKDALNRALDAASSAYEWPQLLMADETGRRQVSDATLPTFISGDSFFPAPFAMGRLKRIQLQSQVTPPLEIVSSDELYERAGSSLTATGKPLYAATVGKTAQVQKLAADSALTMTSSSSANNNSKTVRVYFKKAAGHLGQKNWSDVTGNFSAGVSIGSAVQIESGYPIEAVSIPAGWAGSCNIKDGSDNTIVAIQAVEEPPTNTNGLPVVVSKALVKVWPVPDADYAATVIWWRVPLLMTEDEDIPEIPVASFLVAKAAADVFAQQGKLRESQAWEGRAAVALQATLRQSSNTKRLTTRPYGGNFVDANGASAWVNW